jgi:hypothetical protein
MEVVLVKTFVSKSAVEAFNESVLNRFSRRDMVQFYAAIGGPAGHRERTHLRAVVENDCLWIAAQLGDHVERARHSFAGKTEVRLEREVLSRTVVAYGQDSKSATVAKTVVNEIERPATVWYEGGGFNGPAAQRELPSNAFADLQIRGSIDPGDALMVVEDAFSSEKYR